MISKIFAQDLKKNSLFQVFASNENFGFDAIEFDSRDISNPEKTLFVCLKGQKSDGHRFINDLMKKGVKNFLVSDPKYIQSDANFYLCSDTVLGFQEIAKHNRQLFGKEVIAITGSNGKTIVKEWLGQLLSIKFNVCKSPKSFNSQIGVPYSVSKLSAHDCAIFETGISQKGEMLALEKVIQPTMGIFTNLGDAHNEGFDSLEQKLLEKLSLFKNCQKIIYSSNQQQIDQTLKNTFNSEKLISWGETGTYKVRFENQSKKTIIRINKESFSVNFIDLASLENACHGIVTALELGLSAEMIQYGLNFLKSVDMRFELKEGANNNLILNDSYNNDLSGLKMTLDLAKKLNNNQQMILIASDFMHQNSKDGDWASELNNLLINSNLYSILWLGNLGIDNPKIKYFPKKELLIKHLQEQNFQNNFFIIKGARQFNLEQIADVLELKQHITRIEVNLSRLIQNYNYYKSLLKPETKIMVMVKAFAYGTGMVEVAKLLEMNQVDYLAVAYTDEGVLLRKNGITKPIMVMNVVKDDLDNLLTYNLEPEIFSLSQLDYFVSKKAALSYHIKLDTGMHRLGFDTENLPKLLTYLSDNKGIEIKSILTHLASTDAASDDDYTRSQITRFQDFSLKIEALIGKKVLKHCLNSAGIERFTDFQFDMVRLGIGIYGFGVTENSPLKQVISLKTHISQIRNLDKTETVGYNRKGKLHRDSKIATIPIGYADGYDRRFSGGVGSVIINGKIAPVIGNVCMDMTMLDVTDIQCQEGDEVIIYNDTLTVDNQASKIGTISYELLTHLSERVRRIFYFD